MPKQKIYLFISLFIVAATVILLVTGSPILTKTLSANSKVPLGNLITWAGFMALPLSIYFGVNRLYDPKKPRDKTLALLLRFSILLAFLWAPVSYLLAGNPSFTFSEKATFQGGQSAMKIFWYFSYAIVAFPLLLFIMFGSLNLMFRKRD